MPGGDTRIPNYADVAWKIAEDTANYIDLRNLNDRIHDKERFQEIMSDYLTRNILDSGYAEKSRRALYGDMLMDDYDYFMNGSNKLPYYIGIDLIADALDRSINDYYGDKIRQDLGKRNTFDAIKNDVLNSYDMHKVVLPTLDNPLLLENYNANKTQVVQIGDPTCTKTITEKINTDALKTDGLYDKYKKSEEGYRLTIKEINNGNG